MISSIELSMIFIRRKKRCKKNAQIICICNFEKNIFLQCRIYLFIYWPNVFIGRPGKKMIFLLILLFILVYPLDDQQHKSTQFS